MSTNPSDVSNSLLRREFLSMSAAASAAILGAVSAETAASAPLPRTSLLQLRPRYHRWHVDPGVEWLETNTDSAQLNWTVPLRQVALVLVDVWDHHYLKDAEARAEAIIQQQFVPLLAGCRKAGMTILHAPSPGHARQHPNWVGAGRSQASDKSDAWPPAAFRSKAGEYAAYRRPVEPREAELGRLRAGLKIHPLAVPIGNEPVVATGDELHEVCRKSGILFLVFAGFNTNACILARDYGTLAMSRRGYEVILLRDCTTGMENRDTQPTLSQTTGAVLLLEMFGQYSTTSEELLAGFSPA